MYTEVHRMVSDIFLCFYTTHVWLDMPTICVFPLDVGYVRLLITVINHSVTGINIDFRKEENVL